MNGARQAGAYFSAEPVQIMTLASPLFDSYLGVEAGAVLCDRHRLRQEEREGNGGRLFFAQDEQASDVESAEGGVKLLHPGIAADPAMIDLLENEIGVVRQAVPGFCQKIEQSEFDLESTGPARHPRVPYQRAVPWP